jgi:TRAP transporter TAXI family solute receptor
MKMKTAAAIAAIFMTFAFSDAAFPETGTGEIFVTIGSGDFSGVYFPAGLAIAKLINDRRDVCGIRATVESTPGSVFNLNAVAAGYLEFGMAQADKQYDAVNGLAEWEKKGPQKPLRSVFSLHHEAVTLLAAVDAGIRALGDLKGKRVNIGNPGSGQRRNAIDALKARGLDPKKDIVAREVNASDAPALLHDNRIDAFFCTVGHPSETVLKAMSGPRQVRIIPISGPSIDRMIRENPHYSRAVIPVKRLYPDLEGPEEAPTFGVVATLNTSSAVPDDVVYALVKVVFENFDAFRGQHPALQELSKTKMFTELSAPFHPGALKYYREIGLIEQ